MLSSISIEVSLAEKMIRTQEYIVERAPLEPPLFLLKILQ